MEKYSKRIIIIHWLTLALLFAAWFLGETLDEARHGGAATTTGYLVHSLVGATVLLFMLARLVFRSRDGVPPAMGDTPMDKAAKGIHYLLYAVLFLLPATGVALVLGSDVGRALLAGDSALLPAKFEGIAALEVHEVLVTVLIALVAVHVLGALKHQFVMKDNIMGRILLRNKA